jgi:hypothetical protein
MLEEKYREWVILYRSGTDYEADLVRDRLDDAGIPAVVLTQRDHAFNLTVGDMANVNVLVPPDRVAEAQQLLASAPLSDEELERAALAANPDAPPAHDSDREVMLDTGNEEIHLSAPEEEDDEDRS